MNFPFTIRKTYITPLSKENVLSFVHDKINSHSKFLFISFSDYKGSVDHNSFKFYEKFNAKQGPAYPNVVGKIKSENPTIIEIKIKPHYFRIAFFMIFPIIFISGAVTGGPMTINGVLRTPELYERILFALFGGGFPLVWCYFDSIRPLKKTEVWLRQELKLQEITPTTN